MTVDAKPLAQITREAVRVLCKEIGVANAMRFVNQFTTGYGDYTQERDLLFGHMTLADITSQMKRRTRHQGKKKGRGAVSFSAKLGGPPRAKK